MSTSPQFVVTKWNAVALWSWEMEQDTCTICKYLFFFVLFSNLRSSLVEKCVTCQANESDENTECPPAFVLFIFFLTNLREFVTMLFISIVLTDGFEHRRLAHFAMHRGKKVAVNEDIYFFFF